MNPKQELPELLRQKQKDMQWQYDARITVGKKAELPWEGHAPVKIILNTPAVKRSEKMPYYINIHGGGFIEGDALTMDSLCQLIADTLGILVVNFNYRLAPDYVFDYQVKELDVVRGYIRGNAERLNVDAGRCGIGGFSAGATLSISSAIRAIQNGTDGYKCCILGYPLTNAHLDAIDPAAPYQPMDDVMMKAIGIYFNGAEDDPACSPLLADAALLRAFPQTLLFTCGRDALSEQGKAFAARLAECGVPLVFKEYKDAFHGFVEVNRPDYFADDPRKNPEQLALNKKAEKLITDCLSTMLCDRDR